MKDRRVYIRADASPEIGYGHFIRCLALADILKDRFECIIYTQNPTLFQHKEASTICELKYLPSDDRKFDLFLENLSGNEIVVLDNYFFTSDYQKKIKDKGCKLVVFGSNDRHYYADAIINFTDLTPDLFSSEPYTRFFIGLEWSLLRSEFYKSPIPKENEKSITICIGGTDQFCFIEIFINIIRNSYPEYTITVISSDKIGFERIQKLKEKGIRTEINLSARQIAEIFANSKISVVSASSVALEALSQQSNVISGYYVKNQENIYKSLVSHGYIWPIGDFFNPDMPLALLDAMSKIDKGSIKKRFHPFITKNLYLQMFSDLCR